GSDNEELRLSAVNALIYAKDQRAAEYAKKMLSEDPDEYRDEYLRILINHCSESDMDLITKLLDSTLTDDRYEAGWHGITLDILKADDGLPDGMYRWIYENSLCSCCRSNAAEVLISHGAFPDECLKECLHDCNTDIRELAEQELDKR
ncbi:MAG: hypothetical protein ILP19_02825, partial [Oscillospiraceae bacterium]|nr:hypothetical protein [Oscillospiraceae bacterium]